MNTDFNTEFIIDSLIFTSVEFVYGFPRKSRLTIILNRKIFKSVTEIKENCLQKKVEMLGIAIIGS